jgi:tRNA-(ms[2]io[6]A)-hydroxylase
MAKKSIDLLCATPDAWIETVLGNFDLFLADHANCERKASALAMSLIVRYPDRTTIIPQLIDLAQEELEHFEQTYQLMAQRGLTLQKDSQDPYVNELLKVARHGRDERFIDRMLISSVVESRGAERFGLVAEAHDDPEIREFYTELRNGELKHAHVFVHLLLQEVDADLVYPRLEELMKIEAEIVSKLDIRPALH